MSNKGLFGLFLSLLGAFGGEYAGFIIYDDLKPLSFGEPLYRYQMPLCRHEIEMLVLLFVSVLCFVCGVALLCICELGIGKKEKRRARGRAKASEKEAGEGEK